MLTAQELMIEGETLLGNYNVEIARYKNDHWVSTLPALFAIVTDQRLILQPHTRKRHEPAIIPGRYIAKVVSMEVERRHMLMLKIRTGHQISMFITGPQCDELAAHLRTMARPRKQVQFRGDLEADTVRKMIEFFNGFEQLV